MKKKRILVFPCGSEIGLEIYRALRYSAHIELIGASSTEDHGRFVYQNYLGNFPMINDPGFVEHTRKAVKDHAIDAIYPTMDQVIFKVKQNEEILECKVISSPLRTTEICYSKFATYREMTGHVLLPAVYPDAKSVTDFPAFVKPDKGYGSRGAKRIDSALQLESYLSESEKSVIMEFLPGREVTVDCFTDRKGRILFAGPRIRKRVMNGISVSTATIQEPDPVFTDLARKINSKLVFQGAWFFQLKENAKGEWALLEIASRLAGSSGVYRMQGINFALLSVFDAFGEDVTVQQNSFSVQVDRALDSRFFLDIQFSHAYIDLDDTLLVNNGLHWILVTLIIQFIGEGKKVILITKHENVLNDTLAKYRIAGLFDEIIHLKKTDRKIDHIKHRDSIFIDDSFSERKEVMETLRIPVFAPDAIECLLRH